MFANGKIFKLVLNLFVLIISITSCSDSKKDLIDVVYDKEKLPTIASDSITELISDSGFIRYKLVTKTWLFFENSQDPHWFFPDGFYGEQFDLNFQVQITLKADTVWNFTQRRLWHLKGHVVVQNINSETFKSDELFWDEKTGRVYSDKYIEINRPNKLMLKGYGFESNQTMTNYRIFRPYDTDIYIEDSNDVLPQ